MNTENGAFFDVVQAGPRAIPKKTPTPPLKMKEPDKPLLLVPELPPKSEQFNGGKQIQNFHTGVTAYELARLKQRVNSRLHSGWTGSRAEQQHCKSWNIRPTFAERVK